MKPGRKFLHRFQNGKNILFVDIVAGNVQDIVDGPVFIGPVSGQGNTPDHQDRISGLIAELTPVPVEMRFFFRPGDIFFNEEFNRCPTASAGIGPDPRPERPGSETHRVFKWLRV